MITLSLYFNYSNSIELKYCNLWLVEIKLMIRNIYNWLVTNALNLVRILRIAIIRFGKSDAAQTAAGMSYYAFFSIFPLLLSLIVGLSYVLEKKTAYDYVIKNINNLLHLVLCLSLSLFPSFF